MESGHVTQFLFWVFDQHVVVIVVTSVKQFLPAIVLPAIFYNKQWKAREMLRDDMPGTCAVHCDPD